MRTAGLVLTAGFAVTPMFAVAAFAADVLAEQPSDLAVTVYRAPDRGNGSIDLRELQGFALVSESRTVHLLAGTSRLRFAGVADGIEPASAIVTGLAGGVIEKNRDSKLLTPTALMAAAVGKPMTLLRTDKKTGKQSRIAGTVLADAEGVVFKTAEGVEALRCSGLPETFSFAGVTELAATPTLSILVHSPAATTTAVTLSYLTRGFDWAADYVATISADGRSMSLGAWVTLANGNGVGFPDAHTQVVAGRVNRESGAVQPIDPGGPILAQCWPRGTTSDAPQYLQFDRILSGSASTNVAAVSPLAMAAGAFKEIAVTDMRKVEQEQLGDLKLYRIPERTTVASLQSKQVRLLDRSSIPITVVYVADLAGADLAGNEVTAFGPALPAHRWLRTTNDAMNHLGLPLPSGRIAVFAMHDGERLLEHESGLRDLAVSEEVEIDMGESADVQVSSIPSGQDTRHSGQDTRVDISNARAAAIAFELRLRLPEGAKVTRSDHLLRLKNGRPIFHLTVPAQETLSVRFGIDARRAPRRYSERRRSS